MNRTEMTKLIIGGLVVALWIFTEGFKVGKDSIDIEPPSKITTEDKRELDKCIGGLKKSLKVLKYLEKQEFCKIKKGDEKWLFQTQETP
jgi:hypothetical protein